MEFTSRTLYDSRKPLDFDQVFFPKKVGSKKDLSRGTRKSLLRIVNSEFGWADVGDYFKYTLKLDLAEAKNSEDKPSYPYLLDESGSVLGFIANMGMDPLDLKYGKVEELVGKEIIGYMYSGKKRMGYSQHGSNIIEGIGIKWVS